MKRFIILSYFVILLTSSTKAIIAYPQMINYYLESGDSVSIILKGDEYCKWAITEDGYTLLPDTLGWLYAKKDTDGYASVSSYRLCALNRRSVELADLLNNTPKQLPIRENSINKKLIRKSISEFSPYAAPKAGNRKVLVILMAFKDLSFKKTKIEINALFNQEKYNEDGAIGSVYDYYASVSYGQLELTCDMLGIYTANNNMDYYGGNGFGGYDRNPQALFEEAIQQAAKEINLENYDSDGDGYLDNVHIVFAGYGEEAGASSSAIWSHEATFNEPYSIAGVKINGYSCAPELRGNNGSGISRIGVHCHEIGHSLGAMDFYDTNYATGGEYIGTGKWDIMASGSWNNDGISPADFNPYVKIYNFGWVNEQFLMEGSNQIFSSNEHINQIYRMDTPVNGEYYLLENRTQSGFNESLPGSGLLIYHIHRDITSVGNEINATYPQKCYIVCASSNTAIPNAISSSFGQINTAGCPFPGTSSNTSFNVATVPAAFCWDNTKCTVDISDIALNNDGSVTLNYIIQGNESTEENVFNEGFENTHVIINKIQGSVSWNVFYNNTSGFHDDYTPSPAEGECYLYMKQTSSKIYQTKNICDVNFNNIPLDPKSVYTLKFLYQNRGNLSDTPILNIFYRTLSMTDCQLLSSYSDLSSSWIEKQIVLINPEENYELTFQGNLSFGGLYIDDVRIYKSIQTGVIPMSDYNNKMYVQDGQLFVYSDKPALLTWTNITGNMQRNYNLTMGENILSFPQKGIYLIRVEKECYKIVIF